MAQLGMRVVAVVPTRIDVDDCGVEPRDLVDQPTADRLGNPMALADRTYFTTAVDLVAHLQAAHLVPGLRRCGRTRGRPFW
jgi:hypothetical protein